MKLVQGIVRWMSSREEKRYRGLCRKNDMKVHSVPYGIMGRVNYCVTSREFPTAQATRASIKEAYLACLDRVTEARRAEPGFVPDQLC